MKVTKAEEEIAKMNYQQTILEAGQEVSNALRLYDSTNKRLVHDREQVLNLNKAVDYTRALFVPERPVDGSIRQRTAHAIGRYAV